MSDNKPTGVIVGTGPCPDCGTDAKFRANKNGHIYVYCLPLADGGCNAHLASRSDKGDEIYARRIKKWNDPGYKKIYLGEKPVPEPEPEPEPDDELEPEPDDEPEPEPDDDEPPPKKKAPKKSATRKPPAPKKSGMFMWDD